MRRVTGLLFLVCLVSGLMWGATDGKKYQDPMPMHPDTSAPDGWGYTWVKSTDPGGRPFRWVDISTRGTLVTGLTDDNVVGPFDMGFNFPYYWYTANRFKVGSNGYIQFDMSTTAYASTFPAIPSANAPNDLMAICVGDLVLSGQTGAGGTVRYWTNGVDSLVVTFDRITEWTPTIVPANTHTFQIILNRADSSINYQYGPQIGRYNATNNTQLAIGIENATGQIGLQYAYSTAPPPHPLMPDSGLAIKIKRTVNTGLQVTDVGIIGGLNASNLAEMNLVGAAKTIQCVVKNFGTVAVSNAPVRYRIFRTGQPDALDTVIVPSLAPSQQVTVTFTRQFTPAVAGPYSALFNVTVPNDIGPGNNNKTAEITSITFGGIGQTTQLAHEIGTQSSGQSWTGGGGYGVAFDLPASIYPVKVESVYVSISSITAQPLTVYIMDGSSGSPGAILAQRVVSTATTGWNIVNFASDNVTISGGKFFVGATGQIAFWLETTAPISYRTWEYTGGWAPYRTGDTQDALIRAVVRRVQASGGCNTFARNWSATGTFPDVPTITYFQASQWLGDTLFVQAPLVGAGSTTIHKYRIGAGWSTGVPLPGTKVGGTLTKAGNKLYYIGGGTTAINGTASNEVLEFDPATQGWTLKAPMPVALAAHGAVSWGDSIIYVVGGPYTGSGTNLDVHYYRIATNTWGTIAASLPAGQGRRTFACGISGNKIIISGGFNTVFLKSTWVGTINSASSITWTAAPDIPTVYTGLSRPGGVAYGDKFFVINGERAGAGGYYDTTHVFSVSTNSWSGLIYGKPFRMSNICNAAAAKCVNDTVRIYVPGGYGSITGGTPGVGTAVFDVINGGSLTGVPEPVAGIPTEFQLSQNYPNPFNPTTTIQFGLPVAADVTLKIYNVLGQEVVTLFNGQRGAGTFQAVWDGRNSVGSQVASGMYFYNLVAKSTDGKNTFTNIKKMLLLK